jgi:hypothetical protein
MTYKGETPDQLLERLDRMGLERVKALVGRGQHFEKKAIPLVKGWIERKEEELRPPAPEPEESVREQKIRLTVEQASRHAEQAEAIAETAKKAALKAKHTALIALTIGVIGTTISLLVLVLLAIR